MSGDFWCKEHSAWNCMCFLPSGSITTSGGGMPRPKAQKITYYGKLEEDEYDRYISSLIDEDEEGGAK